MHENAHVQICTTQLQEEGPPHCPWSDLAQNTHTGRSFFRPWQKKTEKVDFLFAGQTWWNGSVCWNGFSNSHVHSWELTSLTPIHQIYSETQRADRHHWTQQVVDCQRGCGSSIKVEPASRLNFNKFHIFSQFFFQLFFAIFSQMRRNSFHLVPLLIIIVLHWCPPSPPPPTPIQTWTICRIIWLSPTV